MKTAISQVALTDLDPKRMSNLQPLLWPKQFCWALHHSHPPWPQLLQPMISHHESVNFGVFL